MNLSSEYAPDSAVEPAPSYTLRVLSTVSAEFVISKRIVLATSSVCLTNALNATSSLSTEILESTFLTSESVVPVSKENRTVPTTFLSIDSAAPPIAAGNAT